MRSIEVVVDLVPAREGHDGTGLVLPALLLGRSRGARRGQLRLRLEARGDALGAEQLLERRVRVDEQVVRVVCQEVRGSHSPPEPEGPSEYPGRAKLVDMDALLPSS